MSNAKRFDVSPKMQGRRLNPLPENMDSADPGKAVGRGRFPSWLHRKLPAGSALATTGHVVRTKRLYTVCEEAKCPDLFECWSKKTATFLLLGKACTRNCGFCDIDYSTTPAPPDPEEPLHVAESVKELGLKHVVLTMVARDDLIDGGAHHIAEVIAAVRRQQPATSIEVLTSDFLGDPKALDVIIEARPEIFNHNVETVREFSPRVRHTATYDRSLWALGYVGQCGIPLKSGMMVGFGETETQVQETLRDLKAAGCAIVTMGQYLQPNRRKLLVKEFVTLEQFKRYEGYGHEIGIKNMFCGPFVRSSYNAREAYEKL